MGKVTKPQFLKTKESRSGSNRGLSAYQPTALPLGHTGSQTDREREREGGGREQDESERGGEESGVRVCVARKRAALRRTL